MVPPVLSDLARRLTSWLSRPLSAPWCLIGWCAATVLFVGMVRLLGGPASNDSYENVLSTWAIQHGQFACAFPSGYNTTAPLYPLVSGGIAAVERVGHAVPFPPRGALGPHCSQAFLAINTWSLHASAQHDTIEIAYVGWVVLLAGLVAMLRASGRGRCGWEPATLLFVACLPPVWLCLEDTFHPEDLLAMGFALAAVACARRSSWVWAGVLVALAVLSQQFALLVAAPLLVLAPSVRRLAYAAAAAVTVLVVVLPLSAMSSGDVAHAVLFGTGDTGGVGGTLLWELDLHGIPLDLVSRVLPVGLSMLLAWWAARRLGPASLEPVALLALVSVSLGLRLVFEQQLFGYYFMALSVGLVVLDVARGHVRASLIAWLATVSMVYLLGSTALDLLPESLERALTHLLPLSVLALAVLLLVRDVRRRTYTCQLACWLGMVVAALVVWHETDFLGHPPTWLWQVALVPLGIGLACVPLVDAMRERTVPLRRAWHRERPATTAAAGGLVP